MTYLLIQGDELGHMLNIQRYSWVRVAWWPWWLGSWAFTTPNQVSVLVGNWYTTAEQCSKTKQQPQAKIFMGTLLPIYSNISALRCTRVWLRPSNFWEPMKVYGVLYWVDLKSSFWYFCKLLWKNPNNLFVQPIIFLGNCQLMKKTVQVTLLQIWCC